MSQAESSQAISDESGASGIGGIGKTEVIMSLINSYNRYTLGDFLETIFTSTSSLSKPAQTMVTRWLSGQTRTGTRPAEILDAMYRHPHSLKHDEKQTRVSQYKNLRLPQAPPTSRSAAAVSFLPPNPTKEDSHD
ncbi:hypothetical protein FRC12_016204 [Ceratobasidium sp. 428]|nr:hypothetical protein FRC12_016204 [Ceratobasidium sp. 428]